MSIDISLKRTPNTSKQTDDINDLNEYIDALDHELRLAKIVIKMNTEAIASVADELDMLERHLERRFIKTVKQNGQWTIDDAKADINELREKKQKLHDEGEKKAKTLLDEIRKIQAEEVL